MQMWPPLSHLEPSLNCSEKGPGEKLCVNRVLNSFFFWSYLLCVCPADEVRLVGRGDHSPQPTPPSAMADVTMGKFSRRES